MSEQIQAWNSILYFSIISKPIHNTVHWHVLCCADVDIQTLLSLKTWSQIVLKTIAVLSLICCMYLATRSLISEISSLYWVSAKPGYTYCWKNWAQNILWDYETVGEEWVFLMVLMRYWLHLMQWCLVAVQKSLVSLCYHMPSTCRKITNIYVVFRILEGEGHLCRNVIWARTCWKRAARLLISKTQGVSVLSSRTNPWAPKASFLPGMTSSRSSHRRFHSV